MPSSSASAAGGSSYRRGGTSSAGSAIRVFAFGWRALCDLLALLEGLLFVALGTDWALSLVSFAAFNPTSRFIIKPLNCLSSFVT